MTVVDFDTITIEEATERLIDYRGKTPPKTNSGVRLVTAKVVKGGQILNDPAEYIATDFYDEWMRRGLPQRLDILLTTEAPLGEVAILRDAERIALAQRIILLRAKSGLIDPYFLFYALQSDFGQAELKARGSGTTVLGIKQSELRQVRIPLLPFEVQRRIGTVLSAYDELIENSQRRIKILEAMGRTLFREWFVNEKLPGSLKAANLTKGSLGALCTSVKEPYSERLHAARPLLDMSRMPQYTLATAETGAASELATSRILFEPGDTLFGTIRCYLHKVNVVHFSGVTNTSVLVLRPKIAAFRSLVAILASDAETIRWADTNSTGTKMPVINWSLLQNMPAPLPSEDLAKAFEAVAGPMLEQIGVLATRIQKLRHTRDLLLPRLLSGQIKVEAV